MKRNERTIYNRLKKEVTQDTINVEIPVDYTHEGRQAIHELLTIGKGLYATGIYWNDIMECYCIHYERAYTETAKGIKAAQEATDIDAITADMEYRDWTWTGYKKPAQQPAEAPQTAAPAQQDEQPTATIEAAQDATQAATAPAPVAICTIAMSEGPGRQTITWNPVDGMMYSDADENPVDELTYPDADSAREVAEILWSWEGWNLEMIEGK